MKYIVLLIVLPLLFAFLSMLIKSHKDKLLYLGVIVNVGLLFFIEQGEYIIGGFSKPFGITLVLDQYSMVAVVLINVLFLFTIFSHYQSIQKYSTVLLTLLAGVNGLLLTGDLFNLFVFLEITSISAYILTTQSKKYYDTFHYIIIGSIGSGLYLLGVILLYGQFGNLNLSVIAQQLNHSSNVLLPLLLIFVGLAVETKLFPMNGWVKNVYKNANGLVGSIMASIIASTILFTFGRIINAVYIDTFFYNMIIVIAVVTLITGELAAFNGKTMKEILLYSSIGQGGLVTLLMITGFIFPAVLIIINNGISKLIMFSIADNLSKEDEQLDKLKGKFHNHKILGIAFTVSSFSLIGLPLFLGFYAKVNTIIGLLDVNLLLPAIILIITIVEGAYLMKLNILLWHPGNEGEAVMPYEEEKSSSHSLSMILAMCILSLVLLTAGILPEQYGDTILDKPLLNDTHTEYLIDMKGGM